jgi:hypothetical protein
LIEQLEAPAPEVRPVAFRVGLYEAIRRTAAAQREAVAADDLDRFYWLLQERERLLAKAETVQQELDAVDRSRAGDLIRDILAIDQETERLLVARIEEAREELSGMAVGRRALSAYGRNAAVVPFA